MTEYQPRHAQPTDDTDTVGSADAAGGTPEAHRDADEGDGGIERAPGPSGHQD